METIHNEGAMRIEQQLVFEKFPTINLKLAVHYILDKRLSLMPMKYQKSFKRICFRPHNKNLNVVLWYIHHILLTDARLT